MNFPRFWARGRAGNFTCWRWSNVSLSEAQAEADTGARKMAELFKAGARPLERYGYADRPLREPVLHDAFGNRTAVVTRNSYGCEVLNASSAMFVDIDFPEKEAAAPAKHSTGFLGSLFGRASAPEPPPPRDPAQQAIANAERWAREHDGWNWRAYRTRAGLRLLATHTLFDTGDSDCRAAFATLNADPLYRKLCHTQECFRARLTPKPWRCGVTNPPSRWPFPDDAAQREFDRWDSGYRSACQPLATCQFMASMGSGQVHKDIAPLIALHDEATRAASGLPLA
jgi:hypothetical protein